MRQNDPLNQHARKWYIMCSGLLGDLNRAEDEYKRCEAIFVSESWGGDTFISLVRLSAEGTISLDKIVDLNNPTFDVLKRHFDSPKEGLSELHRLYTEKESMTSEDFFYISVQAAYFDNPEFAMEALEKANNMDATGLFHVWLPVMHEVRQLPRFKEFVREIGLVDYWNEFGWPDICHPLDNGDFVCD